MREPVPVKGRERDESWRHCGRPACRCPHTRCGKGWLDDEVDFTRHGHTYSQVTRCPVCELAIPDPRPERVRRSRYASG